jgi:uncharacterized Fe-S cluster-containing protein
MVCEDGCINGPLSGNDFPPLLRRKIFEYESLPEHLPVLFDYANLAFDIGKTFENRQIDKPQYTEEEILEVLKKTGKYKKEDELNCGACGYFLCRDKAVAVLEGMAEIDMCIPYMRKIAESRADKIIEQSPNGVIEVNSDYKIIQYNNTFKDLFNLPHCSEYIGQDYKNVLDIDLFQQDSAEKKSFMARSERYDKQLEIVTFSLLEDKMHVAIVIDISQKLNNKRNLDNLKKETIDKATDVIHKQMRVAQEIASLLGETTAETKATLLDLMNVFKKEETVE